ncbi:MAG: FAD-dependent oxidoreductase, partial [Planctomycetota bacterium]
MPRDVVLVGAGHASLEVTRRLCRSRDVRLTVVSEFEHTTYSGSVPAHLAGLVPRSAAEIGLPGLLASRGVTFIRGRAVRVDPGGVGVTLADGRVVSCDLAAVTVGSATRLPPAVSPGGPVVPVRPMATFIDRLADALAPFREGRAPLIAVVGGGAAAVELALCLRRGAGRPGVLLLTRGRLLPRFPASFVGKAASFLDDAGVRVVTAAEAISQRDGTLTTADGREFSADVSVWATGPAAITGVDLVGTRCDADGFPLAAADLSLRPAGDLFGAGDGVSLEPALPKAGVYAVRQGPVLATNLLRAAAGRP